MRQAACAIGATLALMAAIVVVAFAARHYQHTPIPTGPGTHAAIIRDTWCMRSEDSCRMNFRRSGVWVLTRVRP